MTNPIIKKILEKPFIGPTGEYPDGKINEDDEGALRFGVGELKGSIILDFGTPVHCLVLDPATAIKLADVIKQRALSLL